VSVFIEKRAILFTATGHLWGCGLRRFVQPTAFRKEPRSIVVLHPGDVNVKPFAQIHGGGVEAQTRRSDVEVELVPR
jgi:hypothetical protein